MLEWDCHGEGCVADGLAGPQLTRRSDTERMHLDETGVNWAWCTRAAVMSKGELLQVNTLTVHTPNKVTAACNKSAMPKKSRGTPTMAIQSSSSSGAGVTISVAETYERMRRTAMIPLNRGPFGCLQPPAAVRRRKLALNRSRDSEANAERNNIPCTKPVDSVHNVTIRVIPKVIISSGFRKLVDELSAWHIIGAAP